MFTRVYADRTKMNTKTQKDVLTTGEVAKICHVAPRTVSKWFDNGQLRGYRIPGSRDRRIPLSQLVSFMQAHGMPLDGLDAGRLRVLIMDRDIPERIVEAIDNLERYDLQTASNGFEAGVAAQRFSPHVIVIDAIASEGEAIAICQNIKSHSELSGIAVIAAVGELTDAQANRMLAGGFDNCLIKPYSLRQLVEAVETASNIIQ